MLGERAAIPRRSVERGLELPAYGTRQAGRPNKIVPFVDYLRERLSLPDLSAVRLTREIRERGYDGAYTAVKRFVAAIRPQEQVRPFEVRFETPAGYQAQIDFARFVTEFTDAPGVTRIVWLFSLVLGHSRYIFARYVMHPDHDGSQQAAAYGLDARCTPTTQRHIWQHCTGGCRAHLRLDDKMAPPRARTTRSASTSLTP